MAGIDIKRFLSNFGQNYGQSANSARGAFNLQASAQNAAGQQPHSALAQHSQNFGDGRFDGEDGELDHHEERTTEPIHIRIGDTTNFLVKAAGCCNPVYGDEIVGYVSRGRGLIIHKKGCRSYSLIPNVAERTVSVVWEERPIEISSKVKKR